MKNKWASHFKILNYVTTTQCFKISFLMFIVLSVYGSIVLVAPDGSFIDSILVPFQFPIFNIFMFSILFLNILNTCVVFNKKFNFYTIRLKDKRTYLKELLKIVLMVNIFSLIIFFLLYFIGLILLKLGNIEVHMYQNYNINNVLYVLFYLLRYVVIGMIVSIISVLIFVNFKEKIVILMNVLFLAGFMFSTTVAQIKETFSMLPWDYFNNVSYSSFMTEICYSFLFILILEIIIFIFYKVTLKNKRWEIS